MGKNKNKLRADELLLHLGLAQSLENAGALIMSGVVLLDEKPLTKPGLAVSISSTIRIKNSKGHSWVSRGAIKLEHALKEYAIDPSGMVAVDIGASTGGFTDVLLSYGAKRVYAVDVGYGELAWKLQSDERVIVLDRTNARYLSSEQVPENIDLIVCDASFISLKVVLPAAMELAKDGALLVALIKPQFEVKQHEVGNKGVVSSPELHERVCTEIKDWLSEKSGWKVMGLTTSPIKGPEGNTEFLIYARRL